MEEVEDETVQMAITSFSQEVIVAADGKPVRSGEVHREKVREAMRRFGIPQTLMRLSNCAFPSIEIAKEVFRVLTRDGVFINNVGCPAVGSETWKFFQQYDSSAIPLYPYVMAEEILSSTNFHLLFDFIWGCLPAIVEEDEATKRKKLLVPQERIHKGVFLNADHFFVFGKTNEIKMKINEFQPPIPLVLQTPFLKETIPSLRNSWGGVSATFPEDILKTFITLFTDEGDTILDPCAGTGTAGKVAIQLNRNAILYEIEPKLISVIKEKIQPYARGSE